MSVRKCVSMVPYDALASHSGCSPASHTVFLGLAPGSGPSSTKVFRWTNAPLSCDVDTDWTWQSNITVMFCLFNTTYCGLLQHIVVCSAELWMLFSSANRIWYMFAHYIVFFHLHCICCLHIRAFLKNVIREKLQSNHCSLPGTVRWKKRGTIQLQAQGSTTTSTIIGKINTSKILLYRAIIPDCQAPDLEATEPQKDNSSTHHYVLNLSAECAHHIFWGSFVLWLFHFREELS